MLFVPKLHLRQPVLSYNACGSFTKHPERFQNFRETGNLKHIYIYLYIYTNKLGKACFTHDATYSYSENLAKRTISEKILRERAYEITINPEYDGYRRGLASMVCKFFDKKTRSATKASITEELAQELHMPVIKKFQRRNIYARFKDNIWAADLANILAKSF